MPRQSQGEREEDVRYLGDDSLSSGLLCENDDEPRGARGSARDTWEDGERGFLDRLTDQVYAWMGDEDARHRRAQDRADLSRRRR